MDEICVFSRRFRITRAESEVCAKQIYSRLILFSLRAFILSLTRRFRMATTLSPGLKFLTPDPTSITSPATSVAAPEKGENGKWN